MSSDEVEIRQRLPEKQSSEDEEEEERPVRRKKKKNTAPEYRPSSVQNPSEALKAKKKKKREENLMKSRMISYLMISPSIIYVFTLLYDVISKYSMAGKFYHVVALLFGAFAVTGVCVFFYRFLQPYLKYMAMLSLAVLLVPTLQVYNCSPVHLHNSDLGKMFKLREGAENFVKLAYQQSACWKDISFKTPYALSMYTPRINLTVKPYQIVNTMLTHQDDREDWDEGPPAEILPQQIYLLTSQRSVKRQVYNLYLVMMASAKLEALTGVLELGIDDRENVTLGIVGSVLEMGPRFNETKTQLEDMEYLLRPLVFHAHQVEVFGAPIDQTENPEEYFYDRTKWRKKQPKKKEQK